jgi:hypothetical protein
MEAIIFGTYGIKIENDKMTITPNTHEELGISSLKDFRFRGNSYNIQISENNFSVFRNGIHISTKPIGEAIEIK